MDMYRSAPAHVRGHGRLSGLPVVKALFSCEADTASALSPVTNLALNMDHLAGLGSQCETPKRKLCDRWSLQRSDSSESMDGGLFLESPRALNFRTLEETFEKALHDSGRNPNAKLPVGRRRSLPQNLLGSSPAFKRNLSDSLNCGLFGDDENKENEPFQFKIPTRPSFRSFTRPRCQGESKEALVQRQKSAPACMFSSPGKDSESSSHDLVLVRKSSCTSTTTESSDDGFLDMLDGEEPESDAEFPCGVASLWTAPLVWSRPQVSHEAGSPSNTPMARAATKRPELPHGGVPEKIKRRRSMFEVTEEREPEKGSCLVQCKSFFSKESIENILDSDQRDLIGDFSKDFLFPTVSGKHQELKYITPEMMALILSGQYESLIERCVIIDCRYPYEYDGGHIRGAINLYMEQEVENHLLKTPIRPQGSKRVIIVFHCEFSSERGPRMCKFLREKDRDMNEYPHLHYPELYILSGGYKDFFQKCKSFCDPEGYRPMHHEDFKDDLRTCRLRSRTWAGEKSKRELYSRLKKL